MLIARVRGVTASTRRERHTRDATRTRQDTATDHHRNPHKHSRASSKASRPQQGRAATHNKTPGTQEATTRTHPKTQATAKAGQQQQQSKARRTKQTQPANDRNQAPTLTSTLRPRALEYSPSGKRPPQVPILSEVRPPYWDRQIIANALLQ